MPISRSARSFKARIVGITLGDPAGIGPEVALKALQRFKSNPSFQPVLLGKASFFSSLSRRLKLSLSFFDVGNPADFLKSKQKLPCFFDGTFPDKVALGRSEPELTVLAVRSIELAVGLAMAGSIEAVVTPPIHKAGLKKAGYHDMPGHTEYLAKLSGTRRFEMMLVGGGLRVVPVTRHVPLKDVPALLSQRKIEEAIRLTAEELRSSFGIKNPKLVVCGLNPHAGESGVLGREEIRTIAPAVRAVRRKKIHARLFGPLSPDALFHDAYAGRYDAVICMYHDQGLIPLKMISRGHGVNVTLGLPFVRTSPDHGTGYDIAKFFSADPGSMAEAIRLALVLLQNRKKYGGSSPRN